MWKRGTLRIIAPSLVSVLLFTAALFLLFLPALKEQALDRKREMIRELTEIAWATVARFEDEERAGRLTREEAQARAIERIRTLRYGGEAKDYFWINDLHPRMVIHPYRPDLDGQDLTDFADPAGKHLFVEFVKVVREHGAGYVDYLWQWKDDPNHIVPKLSYVKGFAPWGWIIGTGVYIEDVRAEIAAMARKVTGVSLGILAVISLLSAYIIAQTANAQRQRRCAEAEKLKLQEQLHRSQKMEAVGQLAAGIAHDFNNLLTVVLGRVDEIKNLHLPELRSTESLNDIERAVQQARGVTRSLLTFSSRAPASKEPLNLCSLVHESARLLRRVLPASIDLIVDAGGESPFWVNGDRPQLQQVILNLALNARDAMPDGGTLHLQVAGGGDNDGPGGFVRLVLRDTGAGMGPEVQARVFEPFFTTKPRGQGTGLGLAIVHGIVQEHEGWVEVSSALAQGTTFTVILPLLPAEGRAAEPGEAAAVPLGRGEGILLAEGNRNIRMIIASTLRGLGYDVVQVSGGASVLEWYRRDGARVALLLLSLDLADGGGLKCLRELRAAGAQTPAILMAGIPQANLAAQLDEDTVVLEKPFLMSELSRLVCERLRGRPGKETQS